MTTSTAALVALLVASARADFDVTLLVTREVRGAQYVVSSETLQQCPSASASSCAACVGGAARRKTVLENGVWGGGDNDVCRIDAGAFFSGAGKFFPAFNGSVSAEYFADAGYDGFGLTYRDFSIGGPDVLAAYLERARAIDTGLPKATLTNFDASGDAQSFKRQANAQ